MQAAGGGGGGGGVSATASYWRVLVENNNGDSFVVIDEIEFLDTSGNIVPATGGSPVTNGSSASLAFDGDKTSSGWFSGTPAGAWVGYSYPSAQEISAVRLYNRAGGNNAQQPLDCRLEYSDNGSDWTTLFSFTNIILTGGKTYDETFDTSTIEAGHYRCWRVRIPTVNSGDYAACSEMYLRDTIGGADLVPVHTGYINDLDGLGATLYSGAGSGGPAWEAFDGVEGGGNFWIGPIAGPPALGFCFPTPQEIVEIMYMVHSSNSLWRPTEIQIQCSHDNARWTTTDTYSSLTWSADEKKIFSVTQP